VSGIDDMLALNNAHKAETGELTREQLTDLLDGAFHSATEGAGRDGFLIAFDQDASYQSPNFLWFRTRYDRFVYVDRIIVAAHARGRGLARTFYEALFNRARTEGHDRVVCEVNLDPPNPDSLAFHAALGFAAAGEAVLANGKRVQYMERLL
jgi:uncharacterized protein